MCTAALPLCILLFVQSKAFQNSNENISLCTNKESAYVEAVIQLEGDLSIGEDTDSDLYLPCTLIIPPTASEDISQILSSGKEELTVYISYKRSHSY